jgi:hypothetical protein
VKCHECGSERKMHFTCEMCGAGVRRDRELGVAGKVVRQARRDASVGTGSPLPWDATRNRGRRPKPDRK